MNPRPAIPSPANAPRSPGELFAAHRARVYQWACAHGLTHDEALDVTQEAFARFLAARPVCPGEGAQVAWLRRTASNLAVDARRGPRARTKPLPEGLRLAGVEPAPEDADRERLRAAVSSLSTLQRLVLIAKAVDGQTFAMIAEDLGIAPPTAKTHYARALARLREVVGEGPRQGVQR